MKKFILIIIALITLNVTSALATVECFYCGEPFCPMLRVYTQSNNNADFNSFWRKYTGIADLECNCLDYYRLGNFEDELANKFSSDKLIDYAIQKNDQELISYLRNFFTYKNSMSDLYNAWDYPTEDDIATLKADIKTVLKACESYSGTKFKERYLLLRMRCLFQLERYADIEKLWMSDGIKTQEPALLNEMKGLFAGALYHQKKEDPAIPIFLEIGDMQSAYYCLDSKRSVAGIKEIYSKDKNSPVLPFLIQDFVNMMQYNCYNDYEPRWDYYGISTSEAKEFIEFANNVADKKGASKTPLLWKEAAALMSMFVNDNANAKKYIDQAMSMDGTPVLKNNARAIKLLIYTNDMKYTASNASYLLTEFKWLDSESSDPYFYSGIADVVLNKHLFNANKDSNKNFAYLCKFVTDYDEMEIPELENYYNYLSNSKKMDNFEKYLLAKKNNYTNPLSSATDYLGRKYLGILDFDKAIAYLSKVPLEYYDGTMAEYFQYRDYTKSRWIEEQSWIDDWSCETKASSNLILEYAKDLKAQFAEYSSAYGEDRCKIAHQIAIKLGQATRYGNCWFMIEHSWSTWADKTPNQVRYENKCLELLDVAAKSSDKEILQDAIYAKVWLTWHHYEYYNFGGWVAFDQTVNDAMNNSMATLKKYWDGVYGAGEWSYQCDYIMDWVRTH